MTTLTISMPVPASPKRSYEDAGLSHENLSSTAPSESSMISQPFQNPTGAAQQSVLKDVIPSIGFNNLIKSSVISPLAPSNTVEKPAKRAKLSTEEKEAKRIEKEAKDRLKIEEKARREEERAKKDAEKASKEEERRKVREAKGELARLKEEEKQKKEEEKMKKARSQLRLNAFFQQPANSTCKTEGSPTKSPSKPIEPSPLSSRRSSIAEINTMELGHRSRSASLQATPSKSQMSDYNRCFPTFFVQSHTKLAPQNRISRGLLHAVEIIDAALSWQNHDVNVSNDRINELRHLLPVSRKIPKQALSLKEVIQRMKGYSNNPVDLTATGSNDLKSTFALRDIPVKYLKFAEDVRPPYVGTYSKIPSRGSLQSLAKNPFARVRPDTNYDWDSEAEWEDVVDGEDCESEGEEEEEDEDEEEMAGFLDDEDANTVKRRPLLGDQEPQCSGICWEGESLSSNGRPRSKFNAYRIDSLLENPCFPIDPFSLAYWSPKQIEPKPTNRIPANQTTLMEPPRIPLSPINRSNALLKPSATTVPGSDKSSKRFVDPEIMVEFKQAIVGSNLTKMGLCETLKVQFPKQKKDAIKDTLEAVAERIGSKATEKRWVLRECV